MNRLSGVTIASISTATGASAQGTARKYGIEKIFGNADALIEDDASNTILITTRHDHHASAVLKSIASGKHVFVEKPLCIREEQLEAISDAYHRLSNRPVLTVGFNRRFSSHAQELRKWIEASGERPVIRYRVNAGTIPLNHWIQDPEIGGGRIIGEVCHFVDLCCYLTNSSVSEVYAASLDTPGDYRGDNVCITLKHADGSRSTIDYLANGDPSCAKEVIEIFCGRGLAVCDDFQQTIFHRAGKKRKIKTSGMDKGFQAELEAFTKSVTGRGPIPIPFESLRNTTLSTFRILKSMATGEACPV